MNYELHHNCTNCTMKSPPNLQAHCQSPVSQRINQSFVKGTSKSSYIAKGILAIAQKQNKFVLHGQVNDY
ncbi:MAG: hypothetical protein JW870_07435 [Candidatus Delongbacteria bacterium]|nr:hypothetical protein [Candidatus Delongbacteria bacterium]